MWGTCMGFQELLCLTSDDTSILESSFDSYNYTIPLIFTVDPSTSKLFRGAPSNVIQILKNEPVTMNNHHAGLSTATFNS